MSGFASRQRTCLCSVKCSMLSTSISWANKWSETDKLTCSGSHPTRATMQTASTASCSQRWKDISGWNKQDFGCIKMDAQVTETFSMGLFIARVQRGSQIHVEETSVDNIWVPERIGVRGSAKILFLKSLNIDRILTYSQYDRVADSPYSVSK